ncbi:MAG: hypothetical protein ACI4JN_07050, partial [Ruminococcus sp.]
MQITINKFISALLILLIFLACLYAMFIADISFTSCLYILEGISLIGLIRSKITNKNNNSI